MAKERRHADADAAEDAGYPRRSRAAAARDWRRTVAHRICGRDADVVARAKAKRERKHADLIVANDVSRSDAGFDVDTNAVTIVGADGAETLPLQSKARVAGGDPRPRRAADRTRAGITARSTERRDVRLRRANCLASGGSGCAHGSRSAERASRIRRGAWRHRSQPGRGLADARR